MNAELRRNLWTELTVHRLVAMPVLLALGLGLVFLAGGRDIGPVATASAALAFAMLGLWGARCTSDCVMEERRGRTWDGQRLSAIGPWTMAWGKLLGSAAFAWYGGVLSLAVLVFTRPGEWTHSTAYVAALVLAAGLLAQAGAGLAGILAARKGLLRQGALGTLLVFLLLVLIGPAGGLLSADAPRVEWWTFTVRASDFVMASAFAFAGWALFGFYRVMCSELQVRTTPWAYVAFALFLTGYLAGFAVHAASPASGSRAALLVAGFVVSAALAYLDAFSEPVRVITVRRIQVRIARREWRQALEEVPCWAAALALATLFALSSVFLLRIPDFPPHVGLMPVAALLLVVRDFSIYLFFAFAWRPRRPEAAALFYLLLLYGIAPWLFRAAGVPAVAEAILPPVLDAPLQALFTAAIQAALAGGAAAWRWAGYHRREALPAGA